MRTSQSLRILILVSLWAFCLNHPALIAAEDTQQKTIEQLSSTQRKTAILDIVRQGNWDAAQDFALKWTAIDQESSYPPFVIDVAVQIKGEEGKLRRGEYDFPYSDRKAMQEIADWARAAAVDDPKNVHFAVLTAMAYSPGALHDADMFVELLGKARRLDSSNAFILQALGSGYGAQGKYNEAIEVLKKAIEINPKASGAYTNLGVAYLKKGNQAEALTALKKAVEMNKDDGTAWFNLGSYYAERNQTQAARIPLENAVRIRPKLLEARWNLGGVYFNSGEQSKAVLQLKEMVKIAPNSPMGRQATGMLRQLGE